LSEVPLSSQLQEELVRLQQLQQTYQVITTQRQQLEGERIEVEKAFNELKKMDDEAIVYKSIGTILVNSNRRTLIEELTERKDLLEMRIKVLTRQQERAEERLKELQQKVQQRLKNSS